MHRRRVSDRGPVHHRNEDAFPLEVAGRHVAVVCDGISSASAGNVAARDAARAAGTVLPNARDGSGARPRAADRRRDRGGAVAAVQVPWTTRARPGRPVVHARLRALPRPSGRDRLGRRQPRLLVRRRRARQLTVDDSFAEEQIGAGLLTPEQAAQAHSSTRSRTGSARTHPSDRPACTSATRERPGRLVLCTDGLWNYAADARSSAGSSRSCRAGASAAAVARALTDMAITRGGHDNITVAVVDVDPSTPDEEHAMSTFTVEVYQNEYLPLGGSEVNAIVTVTVRGRGRVLAAARRGRDRDRRHLGVDGLPVAKIKAARQATGVAIDCIRDGVAFARDRGHDHADTVYPPAGGLVRRLRGHARRGQEGSARLHADGGTAIGSWLTRAGELFATAPGRICHAILLTDGENQHETLEQLDAALANVEGKFQCDCRGVGTDWE